MLENLPIYKFSAIFVTCHFLAFFKMIGNEGSTPQNFDMINWKKPIHFLKNHSEFDKKGDQNWYL